MENINEMGIELICVIVNDGHGSKILKIAKQHGVHGGTIFLGKGTVKSRLLEILSLYDVRKEIVWMAAERKTALDTLSKLDAEVHFDKPHHGIAFTIPIDGIMGTSCINCGKNIERGVDFMHKAIFTIVDKGRAEDVIEAAVNAGSRGGTIINARGSGIHETSKLFSMEIEPEKEIVMILAEAAATDAIAIAIKDRLKIDEPGNGVIFIQDVGKVYGMYPSANA